MALTRDITMLLIARILQGLSGAVVATVGYAILFDVVGSEKIGQALGFVSMSQSFGLLVGPAVGGIIYEHGGYFRTFIPAFILIAFEIALRFLVVVRKRRGESVHTPEDEEEGSKAGLLPKGDITNPSYGSAPQPPSSVENVTAQSPKANPPTETEPLPTVNASSTYNTITVLLAHPRILVALVALFILNSILTAYDATVPVYIRSAFSLTATDASFLFLIMVTPFLLAPIAGYITDQYGTKLPAAIGLSLIVPPVFILQYVAAGTSFPFRAIGILLFIIGFATAVSLPALMAEVSLVVESIEKQKPGIFGEQGVVAFSFGVMNTAFAGGFLAGPVLAGWLMGIVGWKGLNYVLSIAGLASVLGVGMCTGGWVWKRRMESERN
ncbi:MAG: hypothetical protein Q9225_002391 [Loekoesia sp. 1 TL-2023]